MSEITVTGKLEGSYVQLDQPFAFPVCCGRCGHPTDSGHVCQTGPAFVEATLKRIEAKLDKVFFVYGDVLKPDFTELTDRENDIARVLVSGKSRKALAAELGLSEKTIKNHLSSIFAKLGVNSSVELAIIATKRGMDR